MAANALCLLLLYKHKDDDREHALYLALPRNDVLANLGVTLRSPPRFSGSVPPAGHRQRGVIAAMILISSIGILREALHELEGKQA
ncbi:MAG: hypothetical protein IPP68_08930 [Elusimicrobia bacterium]|nr:hypothetical protein [Elusimicrobiota bacterium]